MLADDRAKHGRRDGRDAASICPGRVMIMQGRGLNRCPWPMRETFLRSPSNIPPVIVHRRRLRGWRGARPGRLAPEESGVLPTRPNWAKLIEIGKVYDRRLPAAIRPEAKANDRGKHQPADE